MSMYYFTYRLHPALLWKSCLSLQPGKTKKTIVNWKIEYWKKKNMVLLKFWDLNYSPWLGPRVVYLRWCLHVLRTRAVFLLLSGGMLLCRCVRLAFSICLVVQRDVGPYMCHTGLLFPLLLWCENVGIGICCGWWDVLYNVLCSGEMLLFCNSIQWFMYSNHEIQFSII